MFLHCGEEAAPKKVQRNLVQQKKETKIRTLLAERQNATLENAIVSVCFTPAGRQLMPVQDGKGLEHDASDRTPKESM